MFPKFFWELLRCLPSCGHCNITPTPPHLSETALIFHWSCHSGLEAYEKLGVIRGVKELCGPVRQ